MTEGEKQSHDEKASQLTQIYEMIEVYAKDYKISQQINQRMIDDSITIDVLFHFDERSLCETIDSWNIVTKLSYYCVVV